MAQDTDTVYVVAYRDAADTESDAEAWRDGDFEAYNYYDDQAEACKVVQKLRDELRENKRRDQKVFIHKARRSWCEANLD